MTKEQLKPALASVWALVYRSSQEDLTATQLKELQEALTVLSAGLDGDASFSARATYINDCVLTSGILSIPYRKPRRTEGIMADCEQLQRQLDASR